MTKQELLPSGRSLGPLETVPTEVALVVGAQLRKALNLASLSMILGLKGSKEEQQNIESITD